MRSNHEEHKEEEQQWQMANHRDRSFVTTLPSKRKVAYDETFKKLLLVFRVLRALVVKLF